MQNIQFEDLYQSESVKGEKAAYFLRWMIILLLGLAAIMMVATGRYVEALPYTFILIAVDFIYNAFLTILYKKKKLDLPWIKFVSVTLDISLITMNHFITSTYANTFAVATFATILLYPVLILYAALRHNRTLIIYSTIYSLLVFNLAYFFIYPNMDPDIIAQVASTDPMGQIYKSLYIALFGFSLLLVPRTIHNLIARQAELLDAKMQDEIKIKLHKQREQQLIENLYKFVSKEVAQKLLLDPDLLKGKTAHITAFFVDIRGFTKYCTNSSADDILGFLNRFYTIVGDAIKEHGGLVNKFLGDSVFAIFGAPDGYVNTEQRAFNACIDVLHRIDEHSNAFKLDFGIDLKIGIGIDSGNALVGNVGSTDHIEYTALGDVVNMASRYEKLNKRFNTRILFSSGVQNAIEGLFDSIELEYLGEHLVRGTSTERPFYTIKGLGQTG